MFIFKRNELKYFISISFLILSSILSIAQPVSQRSSDAITVMDGNLFAKNSFRPAVFQDTTAGTIGLDSCGKLIFTYSDNSYWIRACNPKRWIKLLKTGDVANAAWGSITGTLSNQTDLQNALNLKFNISDTTNKWVQDVYVRDDSLFKFKNGAETYLDQINENIGNTSLTADGNYSQNWSENQWVLDSIGGAFLMRMGGVGSTGTRRKEFRINWGGSSFGDQMDGYNILASIKKADLSADSLTMGLMSSGTGVLSMGTYNIANSANNTFISYNMNSGLINIRAKDSIWITGAVPSATADSVLGVVFRSPGVSKIVKIPLNAGGGVTLNNIGAGYRYVATPAGDVKTSFAGFGILKDSTTNANGITDKVDTTALKGIYLPLHLNADKIIDQNGFNLYFTGSGQFQADSVKYTELVAPPAVNDMIMLGNSIAFGQGASVADSSLKNRLSTYYGLALVDLSLSGSGVWRAASNFYLNVNPGHNNLTVIMAGLNDVRRNAYAPKTHNKIVNGYQGVFINQYMDTWVTAADASVTKIGSWSSGYTSSTVGGKGANGGIFSTTAGDTARWDFTGTSVAVGLMGADSVGGSSYEYGNGKIFIDDVFIMNIREGNQWDGVSDGVNDNKRGTYPLFFTGLSNGSHNIKIVQDDPGVFFVIDYFATLVEPASGKPLILVHAPYLNNAGYATSPNLANNSIIDSLNTLIDSMYTVFTAAGYPVYLSQIENCYDTLTGLSGDNIHPNDLGYRQMFDCTKLAAPSFGTQATKGTIYYANYGFFYGSRDGLPKLLAYVGDTASYILNRTSIAQTAGFKINGTGTAANFVAPAAAFGNVSLASATGVLLDMTPVAGQSLITVTGNITGSVITNNTNVGATTGLLWVQRNISNATGAYSALALAVEGSGDGTGSAQITFRNDGLAREYVMGMDVSNERFEIDWGNQDQLNGRHLFSLDSNGVMHLRTPPSGAITDSLLVYRASDTSVRMINVSSIGGGATTIYNGDGTVSGNRDVNLNNLNLTFSDANTFSVNYDMLVQAKANATIPYTSVIGLTAGNYWQFAHTPSAGSFTRGNAVIVDTLNNVGLGDVTQTAMPLYSTGNSTYIAGGLQSRQGNFYAVTTKTTTGSIALTEYFILIDATGGNITLSLPAASTAFGSGMGIQYVFKRIDNVLANTITVQRNATPGTDTIDGATSFTLVTQYEVKEVQCSSTSTFSIK